VSALAIHHLDDEDKRALMRRVHHSLRPGGVFVNAEQVAGPSPVFTRMYADWHATRAHAAGSDPHEWDAAVARMAHDHCAPLARQLAWLQRVGFAETDCLFKHYNFAVIVGVR
jgi:tRNA (cmo5U34)-methyltransferase